MPITWLCILYAFAFSPRNIFPLVFLNEIWCNKQIRKRLVRHTFSFLLLLLFSFSFHRFEFRCFVSSCSNARDTGSKLHLLGILDMDGIIIVSFLWVESRKHPKCTDTIGKLRVSCMLYAPIAYFNSNIEHIHTQTHNTLRMLSNTIEHISLTASETHLIMITHFLNKLSTYCALCYNSFRTCANQTNKIILSFKCEWDESPSTITIGHKHIHSSA